MANDGVSAVAAGWLFVLLGGFIVLGYEWHFRHSTARQPQRHARNTHARLRSDWVRSLMQHPGNGLLAVQTIRNSVMSASVTASTAVLALMGTVSLASARMAPGTLDYNRLHALLQLTPRAALTVMLVGILFSTFVLSAMAVRFFNHAGYMMTTIADGKVREQLEASACHYMVRAGIYYSMGMRTLLWMIPVAAGLVSVWLTPLAALALVKVLFWFDRLPAQVDAYSRADEVKS